MCDHHNRDYGADANTWFYRGRDVPDPQLETSNKDDEVGRIHLPDGSQHVVKRQATRVPFGFS